MECNNVRSISNLVQYLEEAMPDNRWCEYPNCTYPWSHASESHHCFMCGERGSHSARQCPKIHHNQERQVNDLSGVETKETHRLVNNPEEITINRCCPMCRQFSDINLNMIIFR